MSTMTFETFEKTVTDKYVKANNINAQVCVGEKTFMLDYVPKDLNHSVAVTSKYVIRLKFMGNDDTEFAFTPEFCNSLPAEDDTTSSIFKTEKGVAIRLHHVGKGKVDDVYIYRSDKKEVFCAALDVGGLTNTRDEQDIMQIAQSSQPPLTKEGEGYSLDSVGWEVIRTAFLRNMKFEELSDSFDIVANSITKMYTDFKKYAKEDLQGIKFEIVQMNYQFRLIVPAKTVEKDVGSYMFRWNASMPMEDANLSINLKGKLFANPNINSNNINKEVVSKDTYSVVFTDNSQKSEVSEITSKPVEVIESTTNRCCAS
jgi:hypothetical protein